MIGRWSEGVGGRIRIIFAVTDGVCRSDAAYAIEIDDIDAVRFQIDCHQLHISDFNNLASRWTEPDTEVALVCRWISAETAETFVHTVGVAISPVDHSVVCGAVFHFELGQAAR